MGKPLSWDASSGQEARSAGGRFFVPVLGLFLALVGGALFLLSMYVLISAGSFEGLSTIGRAFLLGGPLMAVLGVVLVRRRTRASYVDGGDVGRPGDVYALRRGSVLAMNVWAPLLALVGLVFGPLLLIGGLVQLVEGPGFGDRVSGLFLIPFGFGGIYLAGWMGRGSIQAFQLRHHQDPYFLVDDHGIECARGRFSWRDVDRVVEVMDPVGDDRKLRTLIVRLHDGATPLRVERAYLDGMDNDLIGAASLTEYGLELTIGNCAKQAHSALSTYGHTPVRVERTDLLESEEPSEATEAPAEIASPVASVTPAANEATYRRPLPFPPHPESAAAPASEDI